MYLPISTHSFPYEKDHTEKMLPNNDRNLKIRGLLCVIHYSNNFKPFHSYYSYF